MGTLPAKVATRIATGLKKFQPILSSARVRDVGESDTVTIVKDLLHEVFGYDKYAEITSEHMIRGTFCDLAIKIDGDLALLIEVKAIGLELKDNHVKQAVDYAANQGCDWVVLTNGIVWRVYKVLFTKPIENELVVALDLLEINSRNDQQMGLVWLLAKEGWQKARLGEYLSQRQALSRFSIAAVLQGDAVLDAIRRQLRRMSPDVKIESDQIVAVLRNEVLKREVLEGEKADAARRMVSKTAARPLRAQRTNAPAPTLSTEAISDVSGAAATVGLAPT